ncbi:hypothetical protein GCM10009038_24530 [Salinicola rhizosphaerae]|uniref:Tyr recombinase domain-containing protein n=1 Tax=Salinicola rhizosphaerae TaxID=1443141 RepID=A0ABQ3E2V1_9GAMM|nr:hypothetical protein GCM10009038_24530 [Salinicola rhizosphaerae]
MRYSISNITRPRFGEELQTKVTTGVPDAKYSAKACSPTIWRSAKYGVNQCQTWRVSTDLRHCYASLLASKGEALTSIRDLLGHSSLTVTSRYAHADPARWESVVAKLPRISNQTATTH